MNLSVILVAGVLALPPVGYLTYQTIEPVDPHADPTPGVDTPMATLSDPAPQASEAPSEEDASAQQQASERYAGTQRIEYGAGAPWPTCPLQCTYGFSKGSGGLVFSVPPGATRIEVRAVWDARTPATHELGVYLFEPMDDCEYCWISVRGREGPSAITFSYGAPEPGEYLLSAQGTGRAHVVLDQDVRLEAAVVFS